MVLLHINNGSELVLVAHRIKIGDYRGYNTSGRKQEKSGKEIGGCKVLNQKSA